jgi:predicted RecA/RadA family phage recombinase
MTKRKVRDGETLKVTLADAESGDVIIQGGIIGVAKGDADADSDEVVIERRGDFRLVKATGFIPARGDVAFYDDGADGRLEAYAIGHVPLGFYTEAALTGDVTAEIELNPERAQNALVVERCSIFLAPGSATAKLTPFVAPFDGKIIGLSYYTGAKPTSAAGTVLLTALNTAVGPDNTLLNAASFDLEGMTEDALTAFTLTATAADLVLLAGQAAEFIATPNNADVVAGEGIHIFVTFQRT